MDKIDIYKLLIKKLPYEIIEKIDKIIQVDFFDKALEFYKVKNILKYHHNLKSYKITIYFGASEMSTNVYSLNDIKIFVNKNNNWNPIYIKLPNSLIKDYVISNVSDMLGVVIIDMFL